jgi:hypothetical protein
MYLHFVTKVSLQFEIYAKIGFLTPKITHFELPEPHKNFSLELELHKNYAAPQH